MTTTLAIWIVLTIYLVVFSPSGIFSQTSTSRSSVDSTQIGENFYGFSVGLGYIRGFNTGGTDGAIVSCHAHHQFAPHQHIELGLRYTHTIQHHGAANNQLSSINIRTSWIGEAAYSWSLAPSALEHLKLALGISLLRYSELQNVVIPITNIPDAEYQEYLLPGIHTKISYAIPLQKNMSISVYGQLYSFLPRGNLLNIASREYTRFMALSIGAAFTISQ